MSRQTDVNVLVVEDDPDARESLKDILELDGYCVHVASSIAEALQDRDWSSLFAVILDRRLPDGTADMLLPRIREFAPRAAVIIITGYADLDGAVALIRHGIDDFIPKPINHDLLRATLVRVQKLQAAESRAQQSERLAAMGQMMASVAHESRNALQRIVANVDLLRMNLHDNTENVAYLDRICDAAQGLHSLLEELRDYAAPVQLDRDEWDMSRVWQKAWSDVIQQTTGGNIELHENANGIQLNCHVDRIRFEQVFRNLFDNSVAACGASGIVEVACSEEDVEGMTWISIVIHDDGPGLDHEQAQRLFEPFFTTKPRGTGLGMAIVRRLVEAHGGFVDVFPSQKPGAAIRIRLPRSPIAL